MQNSVEILTWNFTKKLVREIFFRNFVQTKAILYQNLWNFSQLFAIFILGLYCAEKIHTSTPICCSHPGKEARPQKKSQKVDTRKNNQDVLFSENQFCALSVRDLLRLTPWVFWYEIFTRISSLWLVLTEIWVPNSSHKIWNNFFINHWHDWKEDSFVCETVWFFPRWILTRLTWILSRLVPNSVAFCPKFFRVLSKILSCFVRNSVEIRTWNFTKKLVREIFSEILCKLRLYSTKTCEISPHFLRFYYGSVLRWKNSNKYPHMLFASR